MGCGASAPSPPPRRGSVRPELVSQGALKEKYEMLNVVLGRGSFAVVKRCKNKHTGEMVACKIISKQSADPTQPAQTTKSLNDEITIF